MNYADAILEIWDKLKRIEHKLDETLNLFRLALANMEIKYGEAKEVI